MSGAWNRKKGAEFEQEVARALGVRRNIGQVRDGGDDITLPPYRIECKRRKKLDTVNDWMTQVRATCEDDEAPVVVFRQDRGKPLVIMDFAQWRDLLVMAGVVARDNCGDLPTGA